MKKWTEKFLNSKVSKGEKESWDNAEKNAKKADKLLQIPKKLYLELSYGIEQRKLIKSIPQRQKPTLFMAGFVVGWAEKNHKIK